MSIRETRPLFIPDLEPIEQREQDQRNDRVPDGFEELVLYSSGLSQRKLYCIDVQQPVILAKSAARSPQRQVFVVGVVRRTQSKDLRLLFCDAGNEFSATGHQDTARLACVFDWSDSPW